MTWTLSADKDWISFDPATGNASTTVKVTVAAGPADEAVITLSASGLESKTCKVVRSDVPVLGVSEIIAAENGTLIATKSSLVTAKTAKGFVISDGTKAVYVYDNGDKKTTQPHIVDVAIKHNVQAIRVEATKMTAEYAEGIDEELKSKGHRLNVEKTTKHYTGNGKLQRIFDKAPDIREHMIFLEEGKRSKEYELFMQNVYSFSITGKNKHDDAPDSLAMAINMALFGGNQLQVMKRMF